jgi:putative ABC transport system permease protein
MRPLPTLARLLSLRMAYRHVRAGFGRMALSVLAIGLGVALVVAVRLMNAAVLSSFLDTVDAVAGRAALTVTAVDDATFPETIVDTVATVPGVRLAVPLVSAVAFPDDGSGELLTVHGVDLTHDAAVRVYHMADDADEVIDDLVAFLAQPDSIVLGREFAERRGLAVGSPLSLVTPTGVRHFTVRGLLEPQGLAQTLQGRLIVMDLYAAQRAFTADGQINRIDVLLDDAADVEAVAATTNRTLPFGFRAEEPSARRELIRKTMGSFQAMLTAFSLLAVVAGLVICFSRLGVIFEGRTWEVGLLRAVGLRKTVVLAELLKESLLLGTMGVAFGLPLGLAVAKFGLPFVASATAITFDTPVPRSTAGYPLSVFGVGASVGVLAAIAAALVPALRLARTRPVAALTMRDQEMPSAAGIHFRWRYRLALIAFICLLIGAQLFLGAPRLGHLTTALIAIAACTLARPLVHVGSRHMMTISRLTLGPTGVFAVGHLQKQPRRTALTIGTLSIGVGTVLMFGMLGWSFERTLVDRLIGRLRADLQVSSAFVGGGYRSAPISEDILSELRRVHGIAAVAGNRQVDIETTSGPIVLDSFDPDCFTNRRLCDWPLDGGALPKALALVASGDAVLASGVFARRAGTHPGDLVHLPSPSGTVSLRVAGITPAQVQNAIVMSREVYRRTWRDPLITYAHAALEPDSDPRSLELTINRELGIKHRVLVRSSKELVDYWAAQARQAFSTLYLMEAVTLLLLLIGVGDTLAAGVLERPREFGMMRAVGLRASQMFAMVMFEGAALACLGLILAGVTGLALGMLWVNVQFPALLGWSLDLHVPWAFAAVTAFLTLLLCLAGSLLPSLRAARLTVAEARRND